MIVTLAVIVATPSTAPELTIPFSSTDAMFGSELVYLTSAFEISYTSSSVITADTFESIFVTDSSSEPSSQISPLSETPSGIVFTVFIVEASVPSTLKVFEFDVSSAFFATYTVYVPVGTTFFSADSL